MMRRDERRAKGSHGGADRIKKGRYYERKTREWLKRIGFSWVEVVGVYVPRVIKGRLIMIRKDLFGCDCVAVNGERMVWAQSKLGKENVSKALIKFREMKWPAGIERWIVCWARGEREPEVTRVNHRGEVIKG